MLEVRDLSKAYGDLYAVDHVSLTLEKGVYGILGANGAGKSTFLNLLTDNLKRTTGEILYDGTEILKMGASLGEAEQFLNGLKGLALTRQQVLDVYMILGGIPYYLDMLERGVPLDVCIDRLFFSQDSPLRGEFDFLFRSLFNDSRYYRKIVEVLSEEMKGMTRKELMDELKLKGGGQLSEILENLKKCDFIRKYSTIGKSERDALYQLTDLYSLFYTRFVANNSGQDKNFWSNMRNSGSRTAWSGYAFEQVCLHHIPQIKKALGISGVLANVYSWSCRPFVDATGAEWRP